MAIDAEQAAIPNSSSNAVLTRPSGIPPWSSDLGLWWRWHPESSRIRAADGAKALVAIAACGGRHAQCARMHLSSPIVGDSSLIPWRIQAALTGGLLHGEREDGLVRGRCGTPLTLQILAKASGFPLTKPTAHCVVGPRRS